MAVIRKCILKEITGHLFCSVEYLLFFLNAILGSDLFCLVLYLTALLVLVELLFLCYIEFIFLPYIVSFIFILRYVEIFYHIQHASFYAM